MQAPGPNQMTAKEWLSLCRLSLVFIVQTGLFLSITLPWKVLKSSRINPPGPDDVFFIYRLDPRDNHKRKWKPTMSLSQCLTLITIANFSSRGTSRREHSELGSALSYISNYFVQAPYGDVQCHFGIWNQVFARTFCKVLK